MRCSRRNSFAQAGGIPWGWTINNGASKSIPPKKRKAPVILTETVTPTGFSQSTWEDNKAARSQKQAKFGQSATFCSHPMTTFSKEADFERAVIPELTQRGWEAEILKPSK